jgi:RNA polymerase sigma-70 factor (ECF subfamily)
MSKLFAARAVVGGTPSEGLELYRNELRAHCYRLLGSFTDAEDVLQDTLERAWAARGSFRESSSVRTWLYRIATNLCLDLLRREKRRARLLPVDAGQHIHGDDSAPPPGEPDAWVTPFPDALLGGAAAASPEAKYLAAETVQLAFITALQRLTPHQRAVLVLRDVLGWSASEVAETLKLRVSAVESALHRARQAVGKSGRRRTPAPAKLGPKEKELIERYLRAWESSDVDALTGLLSAGVVFSMPPNPAWLRGRADVLAYLRRVVLAPGVERRFVSTRGNGTVAFGVYARRTGSGVPHAPHAIQVLSFARGRVTQVVSFHLPHLFGAFGLPAQVG